MSQVVKNNRGFLQLLAVCPAHQRQFLLRTASPQQLHALVQVLYNILKEYILIPEENKRILQPYKDALLNLAETNVPYKTKKRILVRSSVNQSLSGILKPSLFPPSAVLGHGLIRISPWAFMWVKSTIRPAVVYIPSDRSERIYREMLPKSWFMPL